MIYTFGDGFAAGHIWPEWPQMLEIFTDNGVVNHGVVGAGNELIFNTAMKQSFPVTSDDVFLIQWSHATRFDKIIETQDWVQLQKSDSVYKNNQFDVFDNTWWPTSASTLTEIRHYHDFYIQEKQSIERTMLYMISLSSHLRCNNIEHYYFLTYDINFFNHPLQKEITTLPWIKAPSMHRWSKQIPERGMEFQPSPIVHYKFVREFLLPVLGIDVESGILDHIEMKVLNLNMEPFHNDGKKIWDDFKNEISLFFK